MFESHMIQKFFCDILKDIKHLSMHLFQLYNESFL